jgi:hypothetical protein
VRKYAVQVTLASLHGLAIALAVLFCLVMRPDLLASYGAHGSDPASLASSLPATARWALSWWLVPAGSAVGVALSLAGFLPRVRPRSRITLLGAGLVVTVFTLAFAVAAACAPLFGLAAAPLLRDGIA